MSYLIPCSESRPQENNNKKTQANRPDIQGRDWKKVKKKGKFGKKSDDECSGTSTLGALCSIENSCVTLSQALMKVTQN